MNIYMKLAINEARKGMTKLDGGPFGAVIVKDGKILAKAHNTVIKNNNCTEHAEICAITKACKKLNSFNLNGCQLYVTAEPCPMCLCACLWANIEKIYYGCTIADTSILGFRDEKFYEMLNIKTNILTESIERDACLNLFNEYTNLKNKTAY